jgi:Domain of unknown function (DUF4263)
MIRVLYAVEGTAALLSLLQRRGAAVDVVGLDSFVSRLRTNLDAWAMADVLLIEASPRVFADDTAAAEATQRAISVAKDVRGLPPAIAMTDGRRWSGLPILVVVNDMEQYDRYEVAASAIDVTLFTDSVETVYGYLDDLVVAYRRELLADFDDCGFLVSYEHGRYRVGPAMVPRAGLETRLYYGPADRRPNDQWYTIDRELLGVEFEAELFEALINNPDVSEGEMQVFLEAHPHFLTMNYWSDVISHPRLPSDDGRLLIPDFVLKPIVAERFDSEWRVLEIKRPQERLLVGPSNRRRFSSKVLDAIRQVRDYRDYFEDPRNADDVRRVLGHSLRRPQLAVLIGRLADVDEAAIIDREQERENVRIVTYDRLLERQRRLYS